MPYKPPSINPVSASIVAGSPAAIGGSNVNVPPGSPVTVATPPSHVAVRVNVGSSSSIDVTDNGVIVEQAPSVV